MQTKIYVGNLSYSVNDQQLSQYFSEFGSVKEAFIPTDRETGRPRGFAFVTFEDAEGAQKALTADGSEFEGRSLKVNIAKERERTGGDRRGGGGGNW